MACTLIPIKSTEVNYKMILYLLRVLRRASDKVLFLLLSTRHYAETGVLSAIASMWHPHASVPMNERTYCAAEWQHLFVNVFKLCKADQDLKDVEVSGKVALRMVSTCRSLESYQGQPQCSGCSRHGLDRLKLPHTAAVKDEPSDGSLAQSCFRNRHHNRTPVIAVPVLVLFNS